ncbi:hypothetical protein CAPTEDRAFT_212833 [Capitella teleta]|uniref:Uncharacterized protein n=1 Tax=Capitella teleta TaxID=283909 RepID=R7UY38_CAPTE|nr:hypothetical protein CAPTEDRAFT_212833 [Capitella teleta]|eukprot:ELU11209.1 hypothetical protein CAPTEDRAFT_212833 [Capitella teleta]
MEPWWMFGIFLCIGILTAALAKTFSALRLKFYNDRIFLTRTWGLSWGFEPLSPQPDPISKLSLQILRMLVIRNTQKKAHFPEHELDCRASGGMNEREVLSIRAFLINNELVCPLLEDYVLLMRAFTPPKEEIKHENLN